MTNRKTPIHAANPAVEKILTIIGGSPGIRVREIMDRACYSMSHTKNVLSWLSAHKLAACVPDGINRSWHLWASAQKLLAVWEADRDRRQLARGHGKKADRPPCGRDRILVLAKQDGGVSAVQIMAELGVPLNAVGRHTLAMRHQGRLFRASRAGCRLRWFETAERAAAWEAMPEVEPNEWVVAGLKSWENSREGQKARKAERLAAKARRALESEAEFAQRQAARLEAERQERARYLERKAAREAAMAKRLADLEEARVKAEKARKRKVRARNIKAIKPLPGVAPTVTIHKPKPVVTVDYSGAKLTICPSPQFNYRHEYAPSSEAHTGFMCDWQQKRAAA